MFGRQTSPIRQEIPLLFLSEDEMPPILSNEDAIPPNLVNTDEIPPGSPVMADEIPPMRLNELDKHPIFLTT